MQTNVFIDGNSVDAGQDYTSWVKRYEDEVATTSWYIYNEGTTPPNQMHIDGNDGTTGTCWTWQFYAVVEFQNNHTIQSGTIWLPMEFEHYPCGGPERILDKPLLEDGQLASEVPNGFLLEQNYPNPFNPETEITFALPEPSTVRLSVLDVLGREIAVLEEGGLSAGYKSVRWNGRSAKGETVSSGMYFYRLTATGESGEGFIETRKMLMTK
ncbi:MAG: T9SS type A sorting domain-containing protein [Ignavibacteriae bacterium]|nr:T9SS type A sorting domain-containing protein [Ignavibacteriota bacterium]